jgi:hypothetical protein
MGTEAVSRLGAHLFVLESVRGKLTQPGDRLVLAQRNGSGSEGAGGVLTVPEAFPGKTLSEEVRCRWLASIARTYANHRRRVQPSTVWDRDVNAVPGQELRDKAFALCSGLWNRIHNSS